MLRHVSLILQGVWLQALLVGGGGRRVGYALQPFPLMVAGLIFVEHVLGFPV